MIQIHDRESLYAEFEALNRSQAIIRFSPDGIILEANHNFLDAMGYQLSEIQGKHHKIFCDPIDARSNDYKEFWRTLNNGKFHSAQFKRFAKNGQEVWIEASYNPVLDSNGKV